MAAQETDEEYEKRRLAHVASFREKQIAVTAAELEAMRDIVSVLRELPKDGQKRALRWAADHLDNLDDDPMRSFTYGDRPPF
jgi:hypothetical protein